MYDASIYIYMSMRPGPPIYRHWGADPTARRDRPGGYRSRVAMDEDPTEDWSSHRAPGSSRERIQLQETIHARVRRVVVLSAFACVRIRYNCTCITIAWVE